LRAAAILASGDFVFTDDFFEIDAGAERREELRARRRLCASVKPTIISLFPASIPSADTSGRQARET
jgi:hypothetical protein